MTDTAQRSRDLLESYLDAPGIDAVTPEAFFRRLSHHAEGEKWRFNWSAALERWGELIQIGAIAILGGGSGHSLYSHEPWFVVTQRGKALMSRRAQSPHDLSRYMTALRAKVSSPDSIALSYLEEAIGAWKAQLHRACAVMLGCACERLILVVADFIRSRDEQPFTNNLERMMKNAKPASITDVYTQVRGALIAAAEDKRLPGDLARDIVDRRLSSVFEHVRLLRNDSGHPTGAEVSAEEAEAGLLLFPGFHELVSRMLAELKPKPVIS